MENNETESKQENKKSNKVLKVIGKICNVIIWALIIIILALLLITVASKRTDILGYRLYLIMSGSMEPTIKTNDAIITQKIDDPQEGDVIAFENGNMITVHRIVQVYTEGDNKMYQTKGDNNNAVDQGLVQRTQVKGKVIARLPGVGQVIRFLQSHFILLILAIGIILIVLLVRRLI